MSFKQWSAVVTLAVDAAFVWWLVSDILTTLGGTDAPPVAAVATRLLWAGLVLIGLNIVAAIAMAILGSIVTGAQFKDERADERDKAVYARAMRNGYYVVSVGGIVTLVVLAMGHPPALAAYCLFSGGLVAGAAAAASQLIYYRIG